MLIGYSMPPVSGVIFTGGYNGAQWLTTDGYAALVDERPARRARFRWRDDAAPAIGHYVALNITFSAQSPIRIAGVLGFRGLAAGVKVRFIGRPPGGAFDIEMGTQRTVQFADGTVGVWLVAAVATPVIDALQVWIYNDRDGVTWATAATTVDVGELVAMPAIEVDIEPEWNDELVDPSVSTLSIAAQPATVQRQAYRRQAMNLSSDGVAQVRGGALANGMDWNQLRAAMFGDRRVVAIPRWKTPAGAVDVAEVHRTALYGTGRAAPTDHLGGDYYGSSLAFQEVPAMA